jgi:hypothetical protein
MKPDLKAPVSMLLKLRYDGPLSKFAFTINLRRYGLGNLRAASERGEPVPEAGGVLRTTT